MLDIVSNVIARLPETFIGNNKKLAKKKITAKQVKKSKLGVTKPKPKQIKQKMTKIPRATLNQKMCVYALCMTLYNKKELAKQVSNSVSKSMDLADKKIQELKNIQASRMEVVAN